MPLVQVPGILPNRVTDAGYLKNPLGSDPFPYPSNMPVAMWQQTPTFLGWSTTGLPSGVFLQATWQSPTYDLRPDLRGIMESPGTQRNTGATPIWLPRGGAGKLWVQVDNLGARNWGLTGLRVTATEFASVRDGNDLRQITDPEDITTEFVGTADCALGSFLPPGSGYPMRYYRVALKFQFLEDSSAQPGWPDPLYRLSAAYY
jgi:hypothetical protein